jgi:predicted nuclease of restriction endonuclease-like (RecB) superfamily
MRKMCRLERWSVRTLRDRVRSMMFERTAVSRLPEARIREDLQQLREADRLTPSQTSSGTERQKARKDVLTENRLNISVLL